MIYLSIFAEGGQSGLGEPQEGNRGLGDQIQHFQSE